MNTLDDFRQYFIELVENDDDLEAVVFVTDYTEILSLQLDSKLYPALVIEVPDVNITAKSSLDDEFETGFTVIKGLPRDEKYDFYFSKLSELLVIVRRVVHQIYCDAEADKFDADVNTTLSPVYKTTADNCYGWRGYFSLSNT